MTPQVGDTITTAEELDALPNGMIVVDTDGEAWQRWTKFEDSAHVALPAVVLYLPGHPPRPEREVKAEALPLDTLDAIVGHLMADGTRDGLIHANTLNWTFGRSARRLAARGDA